MKREQRLVDLKIEQSGKPTSEKMSSHGSVSDLPADIVCVDRVLIRLVTTEGVLKLLKKLNINKVSKGAKIRNRYNQVPHLTQDTNGKAINPQLDTTNESQEVSPIPAGDHKAHISRRAQWHGKHKTEKT